MIPELFRIPGLNIPVYSFGLMMGIAFIVANLLFVRELRRRGLPEEAGGTITLIAIVGGVAGSKLFSLFENWEAFLRDPGHEIFSAAGLTFYGGLIVAILAIMVYVRRKKLSFLSIADAAAPALIIAYGIGRIGCQLAGDGDYGIPSTLPWAMGYPHGTVPTLSRTNPELTAKFQEMYPGSPVPEDIPVHPTPVYETLACFVIFAVLWKLRKRPMPPGRLFAIYLVLAGVERLLVEFLRLNPLYVGLSMAQWISIGMILLGSAMALRGRGATATAPAR